MYYVLNLNVVCMYYTCVKTLLFSEHCSVLRRHAAVHCTVYNRRPSRDGYPVLSPSCWSARDNSHIMPWRSGLLFHQHRRSVRCNATYGYTHASIIASMFCKSCNCNSSIATRIGFAASYRNTSLRAQLHTFDSDHIHTQFAFGMAHENTVRHTQNRRVELRLYQDGVRGRQVLRCTRGASFCPRLWSLLSSYFF